MKKALITGLTIIQLLLSFAILSSCSREKDGIEPGDNVYGFILGEKKGDLFSRAKGQIKITRLKKNKRSDDPRSDMWIASGALRSSNGVENIRLTFFEDRLMEVIVYFKDTSVKKLNQLKKKLEDTYNTTPKSPDGTTETVYKTYRFETSGTSTTLRRITKIGKTELYIQYLHKKLHRKFLASVRKD